MDNRNDTKYQLQEIIRFHMSYKPKYEELRKHCMTIEQKCIGQNIRVIDLLKTICVNQPKLSVALSRNVNFSRPIVNGPDGITNKHLSVINQQSQSTRINNLIDRDSFEKVLNEVRNAKTVSLTGLISTSNQWPGAQKYERMIQQLQSELLEQRRKCQGLYEILLGVEKDRKICVTDMWEKNCQLNREKTNLQRCIDNLKLEIATLKSDIRLMEAAETGNDVDSQNSNRRANEKLVKLRQELDHERQHTSQNSILYKMVYEELSRIKGNLNDYKLSHEDYERKLDQANDMIRTLSRHNDTLEEAFETERLQKCYAQYSLHQLQIQHKRLLENAESSSSADSN